MKFTLWSLGVLFFVASFARAEEPLYTTKSATTQPISWLDEIRKIPPLKHERGNRWPMITWEGVSFQPQAPEVYKDLLARGLTQHVQLDVKMIPTAKAIQDAGCPVIMMQGAGGPWPAQLAGAPEKWAHQFDADYKPKGETHACLGIYDGWAIEANNVRDILRQFKSAGVTVNAVWMDWEGDPLGTGHDGLEQATHCARCRATVPPSALENRDSYRSYTGRLYYDLIGTYLAAPVNEIFPGCSTTNWMITASTPERPIRYWNGRIIPPGMPTMLNATNPVGYGNSVFWKAWKHEYPLDREHVDQFYTHLLVRMISDDAANRAAWVPEKKSFPWMARWCPDDEDLKIPLMTRERYREVLRHLWLRGVDGMQIFAASRPGFEDIVVSEVQDAVAVYDEMLEYRDVLDQGKPMCFDVPAVQSDAVMWSGLRTKDRAVVRIFKQGGGTSSVKIEPFPGKTIDLPATGDGKTFVLKLDGDTIKTQP